MDTAFASPERSSYEAIIQSREELSRFHRTDEIIDAIPTSVLVLNKNRQIVFANKAFLSSLQLESSDSIVGLRPGELLDCTHADDFKAGCGTSKNCIACGAVRAILAGQQGNSVTEECRILTKNFSAYDYKVHTAPLDTPEERFVVFSITDISGEKRREALERIFFHDVLNTAGGIRGFAEMLEVIPQNELPEYSKILTGLASHLIDEIQAQRDIFSAEKGELRVAFRELDSNEILRSIVNLYSQHPVAAGKGIKLIPGDVAMTLYTDERLVRRVLGNLVKNALEAIEEDDFITIRGKRYFNHYVFCVQNKQVMPKMVQLQIFNRSFSTKGLGRGLGTYSVKLLTEKYLHGRAGFISNKEHGTLFYAIIPVGKKEQ